MRRAHQRQWPGVVLGLVGGLCLASAFGALDVGEQRYQLHVWSADPGGPGHGATHGAYRIDGATGEVYRIGRDGNTAERIGFPQ